MYHRSAGRPPPPTTKGPSVDNTLSDARLTFTLIATLVLLVIWGIADLAMDAPASWFTPHVLVEVTMIGAGAGLAVYFWRGWRAARRELVDARDALERNAADQSAWRRRAQGLMANLREAIDEQFGAWQLTPSEREVAFLLLAGRSHKEIAHQTGRGEPTVRQHAVAAYRKAGVAGRAELAAFFLGDLAAGEDGPPAVRRPS